MSKRKFNGKIYVLAAEHRFKKEAKDWGKRKREQGKLVRVIKSGHGTWMIYTRSIKGG